MLRKLLVTLTVCLSLLLVPAPSVFADGSVKIATMNLQKVLALSSTGQAVKKLVTSKFDVYQEKLRQQEEPLIVLKEEIEKKGSVWSEDVKIKKDREFKRQAQNLEEEAKYAANDLKEFEQQQVGPILKELEGIIAEYGKGKGYTLILDTSKGVLYQDESIDISGDLAVELDKRHPQSKQK